MRVSNDYLACIPGGDVYVFVGLRVIPDKRSVCLSNFFTFRARGRQVRGCSLQTGFGGGG
jgi:hypothetical protein